MGDHLGLLSAAMPMAFNVDDCTVKICADKHVVMEAYTVNID